MSEKNRIIHNFNKSKEIGNIGEIQFLKKYPQFIHLSATKENKTESDFKGKIFGVKVEIKTDTFNPFKTPNFFIERFSSMEEKSPGGPWQALKKGASWFVYWFNQTPDVYYWIRINKTNIEKLNKYVASLPVEAGKEIKNNGYTTFGYAINRNKILEIMNGSFIEDFTNKVEYKFFSGYVGSKRMWVDKLLELRGSSFVEAFAGSAALSANLASSCVLNDFDPYVSKILKNFDKQIVSKDFNISKYMEVRKQEDWWRYAYCLQKMSFSGVFRYSKNGYNVPAKPEGSVNFLNIEDEYNKSLVRWKNLEPNVLNESYINIPEELIKGKILISDPPYSGSKASYNIDSFNYDEYWSWINKNTNIAKAIIIFDRKNNIESRGIPVFDTRKMRVNGAHNGDVEAMAIFSGGKWLTNVDLEKELSTKVA